MTTSASSAAGAFQLISSTYTADINGAIAEDPSIANNIVQGLAGTMDPATEAYAAAYELQQDAQLLQNNNIPNPTVLDVRAVYQFGAGSGPNVAAAPTRRTLRASLISQRLRLRRTVSRRLQQLATGVRTISKS